MERSSREDPLTGLLNRRGFEHALTAIGPGGGTFAILGIELDGIKAVNDTYGHRTGDRILAEIAGRIACWAPPAAILARVGGDEFTVLHRIDAAHRLREADVERLIHALTEPYGTAPSARIGASVGVHTTERLDLRELLLHADAALSAAKSHGDNTFYVFDDELRDSLQRRQDVERDIPAAIGKGELTAWFQPVVRLDRLEVVGFEALLRWTHPVHGPIPPPEIVAAARQTGVVQSITRMVFSNCCNLVETLNRTGERRMKVAMNMSPFELEVTDIETTILAELRGRNLSTDQFEIEITEESSLDYERVRGNLRRLSGAGISIALDDFGTGFSTFSSIRNGWISKIKIDKEFVSGSPASPDDTQLVKSIIDLGRALGIEVCAEGVETGETARLLRSLGCTLAQGFLYSKPVPASDVAAAVARIETARPEVAS